MGTSVEDGTPDGDVRYDAPADSPMSTRADVASPEPVARSATPGGGPLTRRIVLLVFVTVFLDMCGFGIVLPLLPFYVQSLGGSAQTVGLILGSFSLAQLIATPILGRLSDRWGRRPVILFSLAGNAVAMLLFALATDLALLPLLFASRLLAGATAGNLGACQAVIADVTDASERAKGMGRIGAGIGLGMVLGPVMAGVLSPFGSWAPPLGASLLAMADVVAVFFLMPETHPPQPAHWTRDPSPSLSAPVPRRSIWETVRAGNVVYVLAMYFLTFLGLTSIQVALALVAKQRLGWRAAEVGHAFGLFGLVTLTVQGALIDWIARAVGRLNVLVIGAVCLMAGFVALAATASTPPFLAGVVLTGLGVGVTNPTLATLASEYAGSEIRGAVLGIVQSAGGLARTLGPVWAGFLFYRFGAAAPFWSGACAAAVSLAIARRLRIAR